MPYVFTQNSKCARCPQQHSFFWPYEDCPFTGDAYGYVCPDSGLAAHGTVVEAWDQVQTRPPDTVVVEKA